MRAFCNVANAAYMYNVVVAYLLVGKVLLVVWDCDLQVRGHDTSYPRGSYLELDIGNIGHQATAPHQLDARRALSF